MDSMIQLYKSELSDGSFSYFDQNGTIWEPISNTVTTSTLTSILSYFPLTFEWSSIIHDIPTYDVVVFITISVLLVIIGGITSGLNVSLLSIDETKLHILAKTGEEDRKAMCKKLQPIIQDHHLLLVTLLVANAAAMEALPIFLDELVASWLAVIISVTFVLIFGEILPQALFASDPLVAGSKLAWLVRIFKFILYPLCKPIAWLLDHCIPEKHAVLFTQKEISIVCDMIDFKHPDTNTFIQGSLRLQKLTVADAMVDWEQVIRLPASMILNEKGLRTIHSTGFSRVPVYENHDHNIVGLCLVKNLVPVKPDNHVQLGQYARRRPLVVSRDMNLFDCINFFQEKRSHFALVVDKQNLENAKSCFEKKIPIPQNIQFLGAITFEDVIEEVIQEEIYDETEPEESSPPNNTLASAVTTASELTRIGKSNISGVSIEAEENLMKMSEEDLLRLSLLNKFCGKERRNQRIRINNTKYKRYHLLSSRSKHKRTPTDNEDPIARTPVSEPFLYEKNAGFRSADNILLSTSNNKYTNIHYQHTNIDITNTNQSYQFESSMSNPNMTNDVIRQTSSYSAGLQTNNLHGLTMNDKVDKDISKPLLSANTNINKNTDNN